jgi:ABC-type branched-subunit amino acid transport system substrate-binding protein
MGLAIAAMLAGFCLLAVTSFAAETPNSPPAPALAPDSATETLLKRIDTGYYGKPDLPLKKTENYAQTSADIEPFGGVKPYKEHFLVQMEYAGAGRGIPEPTDLTSVKIGFLGPIQPTVSMATGGKSHNEEALGIAMLRGTTLAIEEANARGGYLKRHLPFELAVHNDNALWGASGNELIGLAYKDNVWAIIGGIDGANTHIAIRAALKAEVLWMSPSDLDPTYIETNIPWVMRCISDDRQLNYLLVDYAMRKMEYKRPCIIRASSRYGRFGVRKFRDDCRRLGHPVVIEMAFKEGTTKFDIQLDRVAEYNPDVIFFWGNADDAGRLINAIRGRGWKQPFLACDRVVSDEFLKIAGPNAEGVICGFPWDPERQDPKLDAFREAFRKRWGADADTYATHAYDGANILIWGIQNAGLNRAKIRDLIAYRTEPFHGVTGEIPLTSAMDDGGDVFLAIRQGDKWTYHSREELGIPRGKVIEKPRTQRETAKAK